MASREVFKTSRRLGEVKVRVARRSDAVALATFFVEAWKQAGPGALGFTGATADEIKEISSEEFLTQRLVNPKVRIVIAERESRVLGFASIRVTGRLRAELSGIVVLESESGKRLGRRLLARVFRIAVRLGIRKLLV